MDLCCFEWATSCALRFEGFGYLERVEAMGRTYVAAAVIEQ